jgi:hypothetical protein
MSAADGDIFRSMAKRGTYPGDGFGHEGIVCGRTRQNGR